MVFHAITAKNFEILEIVRYYNTSQARTLMMKERELELNFPRASFSILPLQALTVTAVIPIVWVDFSKFCLPHLNTMASLMLCWCAKFLPMRKTWGRTKQKPAMTDFHHKLNTFWQRSPKCDPLVKNKRDFIRAQNTFYFSRDFDFKIWFRACEVTGTFEKRVKGQFERETLPDLEYSVCRNTRNLFPALDDRQQEKEKDFKLYVSDTFDFAESTVFVATVMLFEEHY